MQPSGKNLPAPSRMCTGTTGTPGVLPSSSFFLRCYPLPLIPSVSPSPSMAPTIPRFHYSSSLLVALVSIAILIVSSSARMTSPHGTVRNERSRERVLLESLEYVATLLCFTCENYWQRRSWLHRREKWTMKDRYNLLLAHGEKGAPLSVTSRYWFSDFCRSWSSIGLFIENARVIS